VRVSGIRRTCASAVAACAGACAVAGAGAALMSTPASAAVTPSYVRTGLWGPGSPGVTTDPERTPGARYDTPAQAGPGGAARPGAVSWKPSGPGGLSVRLWR